MPANALDVNGAIAYSVTNKKTTYYGTPSWSFSTTGGTTGFIPIYSFTYTASTNGMAIITSTGHVQHSINGSWIYVGIMIDGAFVNANSGLFDSFALNAATVQGGSFLIFYTTSILWMGYSHTVCVNLSAGNHTIGIGIFQQGGTMWLNGSAINIGFIPRNTS